MLVLIVLYYEHSQHRYGLIYYTKILVSKQTFKQTGTYFKFEEIFPLYKFTAAKFRNRNKYQQL